MMMQQRPIPQQSALKLAKAPSVHVDRQNRIHSQTQRVHGLLSPPVVVVPKKHRAGDPTGITVISGCWEDKSTNIPTVVVRKKQKFVLPMTALRNNDFSVIPNSNVVVKEPKRLMRGPNVTTGFWQDIDSKDNVGVGKRIGFGRNIQGCIKKDTGTCKEFQNKRFVGLPITGFWKDDNISREDLDTDLDSVRRQCMFYKCNLLI